MGKRKNREVQGRKYNERYRGTCKWIESLPLFLTWMEAPSPATIRTSVAKVETTSENGSKATDDDKPASSPTNADTSAPTDPAFPPANVLWMHAIPGTGKSVLASYIVEYLKSKQGRTKTKDTAVYFFCTHENVDQASAIEVFKSLLLQVLEQYCEVGSEYRVDRGVWHVMKQLKETDLTGLGRDNVSIWTMFGDILRCLNTKGTVRVVIDGADEYANDEVIQLLEFLSYYCFKDDFNLKLLVISRDEKFIRDHFEALSSGMGKP